MSKLPFILFLAFAVSACADRSGNSKKDLSETSAEGYEYAIVIHGGAGYATPESLGPEGILAYEQAMDTALHIGMDLLSEGAPSIDAVEQVIRYLEDNPLFNAGRGAALTSEGLAELDASIMQGWDMNAGAVAGLTSVRHPITAARRVMDSTLHVMLSGPGAVLFAEKQGLMLESKEFFQTEKSKSALARAIKEKKLGTVGCVALDMNGDICAGTSTGGRTNKLPGRVGDVPVIGAGTYAKNGIAGISCTGQGEFYIRLAIAKEVVSLMEYKGYSLDEAAKEVVHEQLKPFDAKGGIICLDPQGKVAMEFNTSAMYRAYGNSKGEKIVKIFP